MVKGGGVYDVSYGIVSSTYCRRVFVWVAS